MIAALDRLRQGFPKYAEGAPDVIGAGERDLALGGRVFDAVEGAWYPDPALFLIYRTKRKLFRHCNSGRILLFSQIVD